MITYEEIGRKSLKHGYQIHGSFHDSATGQTHKMVFFVDSPDPTEEDVTAKISELSNGIEFNANPLNYYELTGADVKPILQDMVRYIRNHPDCTFAQLKNAAETAYPNALWNIEQLIQHIKAYLEKHIGTITFDQFKTYVIEHKFRGID